MHECPNCGQACDCDGEDTWFNFPYNLDCTCDCEDAFDDDEDDLTPDYDERVEMSQARTRAAEQRDEAVRELADSPATDVRTEDK